MRLAYPISVKFLTTVNTEIFLLGKCSFVAYLVVYFIFILLTSPNNKISETRKKKTRSVDIFTCTGVPAETQQQKAPITVDPIAPVTVPFQH